MSEIEDLKNRMEIIEGSIKDIIEILNIQLGMLHKNLNYMRDENKRLSEKLQSKK